MKRALLSGICLIALLPPLAVAAEPLAGDPFAEPAEIADDAAAPGIPFLQRGWLESRNQFRLRDGRAISARQRLWLEGGHHFGGNQAKRLFLSGSLDWDGAAASLSGDTDEFAARLHEAYFTFEGERADLMLGRKMARFGTGDGINPLDLINPQDHRDPFASGRSDNRLPVWLGQTVVALPKPAFLEDFSLQAVAAPLAKVTRLPGRGSVWELPSLRALRQQEDAGTLRLAEQDLPASWFEEGKYLLHLSATTRGWDIGLAAFSGPANTPVLVGRTNAGGERLVTPEHPGMSALGLTFAKGLNRSTLRGELAYKPSHPLQLQSDADALPDFARRDLIEGVIGFDRTFGLNRYLNLQYFAASVPNDAGLAQDGFTHGLTYELYDQFAGDDLKLGVSGIIGFSGQGWTLQPYAEYKLGDDWLLTASVMLFSGDREGSYGQYGDCDFATLKLRRSF